MVKKECCAKAGLNRGAWTSQEDKLLSDYIMAHGLGRWRSLPAKAGLNRCGKSCRLRWLNYLRPDIKRGNITEEEEELIIRLHKLVGNRWSLIAGRLPGRTDNEIKNYWNTYLRKKLLSSSSDSSSKAKKLLSVRPEAEKMGSSEVNVIRTKAVRCTRALFTDQILDNTMNSFLDVLRPTATLGHDDLPNFIRHDSVPPPLSREMDRYCFAEAMQNSLFPQVEKSGSYMIGDSLQHNGNMTAFVNGSYTGGIYNNDREEDDALYPFLHADTWDSLTMSQKI